MISSIFFSSLTIGIFILVLKLNAKMNCNYFNPVLVALLLIGILLVVFHVDYNEYKRGTFIIDFMLGPSVVALGYKLFEQYEMIKAHAIAILTSILVGSVVAILSVILLGKGIGIQQEILVSLIPKSVTTPIAMAITQNLNGVPAITVVVVIAVGIFGAVFGPTILKLVGITTPMATGLAMGAACHGLGTARAFEIGALQGTIAGLAIGIMGICTAILAPIFVSFF